MSKAPATPIEYGVFVRQCRRDGFDRAYSDHVAQAAARKWLKTLPARRFRARADAGAALSFTPDGVRDWCEVGDLYAFGI